MAVDKSMNASHMYALMQVSGVEAGYHIDLNSLCLCLFSCPVAMLTYPMLVGKLKCWGKHRAAGEELWAD